MLVNYQYASASICYQQEDYTIFGLSSDLSRSEKVSFRGKLKHPLIFRDAMLMLREIVISDLSQKKKERTEYFEWLNQEIERRTLEHEKYLQGIRGDLTSQMDELKKQLNDLNKRVSQLEAKKKIIGKEIDKYNIWTDYYKIERDFWAYIRNRDQALWWVLDPVITVHPDQVSFEAFSLDESTYGCLSVDMKEFDLTNMPEPQLGTTNIDFSTKLAREMERFRTYNDVELSINPEGFTVDTGIAPEHLEKKIDLPDSWIKGFNQVSAAASLDGIKIELLPVDMYDICSFLRRNKAHESPRCMRWILEPEKYIKIIFDPWGKVLELSSIYHGKKQRTEKIWGRRRWLTLEKIIPLSKSFTMILLGFGMPQFIIADMGLMKMTIGFTSWTSNDWVKGTAFNIMAGFIGGGNQEVYHLLKEKRIMSLEEINNSLSDSTIEENKAGIGMLLRRGEAYFDPTNDSYRFRQLCNKPLPERLYGVSALEREVKSYLKGNLQSFSLNLTSNLELIADNLYNRNTTQIIFDQDHQISKVKCDCRDFKKGSRNISNPCSHLLALFITASRYIELELEPNKKYNIQKLEEMAEND